MIQQGYSITFEMGLPAFAGFSHIVNITERIQKLRKYDYCS